MLGIYIVKDTNDRELSEADTFQAACMAARCHLTEDGEDGPLMIIAPDGNNIGRAVMDDCGRVTIWTTSLTKPYEEVIKRWGRPEAR